MNKKEKLSADEKETLISFDETGAPACIFTYNKAWQKHLEQKLGLKPIMDNGFGGKEYELDKKRIKPPRARRQVNLRVRRVIKTARSLVKNNVVTRK